jgi:hypothetical protein
MSVTTSARPAQQNIQQVVSGGDAGPAMPAGRLPTGTDGASWPGLTEPDERA